MYITNIYLYTYYSDFTYNNIYNNLSSIRMYKVPHSTVFWRIWSSLTPGGVILALRIQVILAFTHANHATYSRQTIAQYVSVVTLPSLYFRNILISNENLQHSLFASSKYYWLICVIVNYIWAFYLIKKENNFDIRLWAIILNILLIKVHLDMILKL